MGELFKVIRKTFLRRGHFSRALEEMRDTQRKVVTVRRSSKDKSSKTQALLRN